MLFLKNKYILIISFLVIAICAILFFNSTDHKYIPLTPIVHTASKPLNKLPDFSNISNVKEKKEAFFNTLYPIIKEENLHILTIRNTVKLLQSISNQQLSTQQQKWLSDLATSYKVDTNLNDEQFFNYLLKKIDFIPPSLALTQAAIESGWGTSRFSKQGNNLFGQWCFSKGCGMVPLSRDLGKAHEVAQFSTVNLAVRAYIKNLNTNASYSILRQTRALLRAEGKEVTGQLLAKTLNKYSEEGEVYVSKLSKFIDYNKLQRFNTEFNEALISNNTL